MMKIIYLNIGKRANSAANPELNFLVVNLEKAEYSDIVKTLYEITMTMIMITLW